MPNPRIENDTLSENPDTTDTRTAVEDTLKGFETREALPNNSTETPATERQYFGIIQEQMPAEETSPLPLIEVEKLMESEILDGADVKSLAEDISEYTTSSGDAIYAATDKGIGYKDHNEDRVAVMPAHDAAAVFDGMGGEMDGDKAAQSSAEAFLKYPNHPHEAVICAAELIADQATSSEFPENNISGACFAYARISGEHGEKYEQGQKYVEVAKAGDVKVLIFEDGKLTWESHDDSFVQELIDSGTLTKDEAYYFPQSNVVQRYLSANKPDIELIPPKPVKKGALVLIFSDGISLMPEEIETLIQGLTPQEIIKLFSDITDKRMTNAQRTINETDVAGGRENLAKYPDGYLLPPHPDNRSVAIIEIS